MAANNIILYMDQGASFSVNVSVSNAATANTEIDLSNYSARAKFRKHYSSSNSYSLSTAINIENRIITLTMNAASTANVVDGRYLYDVELYSANTGFVFRTTEGLLVVTPEITR